MTDFLNTAEAGVADGTTVPAIGSQSGGAGDALTVTKGSAGTLVYSTTAVHRGSLSYKFTAAAGADTARLSKTSLSASAVAAEVYFRIDVAPTAEIRIIDVYNGTVSAFYVTLRTDLKLSVYDAGSSGTPVYTSTTAISLSALFRVALYGVIGTTTSNGTVKFAAYSGANLDTTTPNDTVFNSTVRNTGTANVTELRVGKINSAGVATLYADDIHLNDAASNFLGPLSAVTATATPTSGSGPLTVTATVTAPTGVGWTLTWGDGGTASTGTGSTTASHTYASVVTTTSYSVDIT